LSTRSLKAQLNPEQWAAVSHGEGPQLVLAGAGSGKTRVITYRIAWLVTERGVDPGSIVAVTFTNKAASEMKERVEALLGSSSPSALSSFVGTFHRFCLALLRRHGGRVGLSPDFAIFDSGDQIQLVKKALKSEQLDPASFTPNSMLSGISAAKSRLLDPDRYESQAEGFFHQRLARVYRRYQGFLAEANAVDFDDMLSLGVRLLRENEEILGRFRRSLEVLLVDEFQDTNEAQMELVRTLVGPDGSLTAVGDEDQAIYRWRGADPGHILEFERSFPGAVVRKLERNYRSTRAILDGASALVSHNVRRRGKTLWTEAEDGEPIALYRGGDEEDEARWVARKVSRLKGEYGLGEMAVLVRTHAQTRALEEAFLAGEIPYSLVGGMRFYERAEIKDLIAYLRLLRNPRDGYSLERVLNQPPRGIGKGTRDLLGQRARELGVPLWDALAQDTFGGFSSRAARALEGFRDLIRGLTNLAGRVPLRELLEQLVRATGYEELCLKSEEGRARLENIQELISAAQVISGELDQDLQLTAFLDHISLVTDLDGWDNRQGVSLMTLHSAKGLEFPVVIIAGLEEGLLPHFNAQDSPDDVEEERRLLYVGMTRARKRLFLSCCRRRRVAGRFQDRNPSPFLDEIPSRSLEVETSLQWRQGGQGRAVYQFFGRQVPEDPVAEGSGVRKGSRVRHPTLGPGVVLETHGEGDDARLTVFFERAGKRKLVARYANLEPL
jgi:DNA helicase-2/ATP-dependent DNA helicase PcrA